MGCFWATAAPMPALAILPFTTETKDMAATAEIFREALVSELVRTGKTTVVEREAIGKILKEQSFQQSGAVENEQAVKLGKILSARYVITGSLRELDHVLIWVVNVVHVESGQIVVSERLEELTIRKLTPASRKLAEEMIQKILDDSKGNVQTTPSTNAPSAISHAGPPARNEQAKYTPFQFGVVGPIQLFPRDFVVVGLSVNVISSENREVRGVDAGLILLVPELMVGVQAGLINITDRLWGVQAGLFNKAGDINALQAGLINIARVVRGVQVGLVNFTERLYGVQIGLVNVASRGPGVPFMIAINIGF